LLPQSAQQVQSPQFQQKQCFLGLLSPNMQNKMAKRNLGQKQTLAWNQAWKY